jgi:tRNA dimethylallyltransferase
MDIDSSFPVILGPTASGKTKLAVQVAAMLNGEIISADSRQVYRNMDIGTGKDLAEYEVNGGKIPYHLIDIVEAGTQYNVNDFQRDFETAFKQIILNGSQPIVCGGTGFYIHALLMGHAYPGIPVNGQLRVELESLSTEELTKRFNTYNTVYQSIADTSTRKRLIRAIEISEHLMAEPSWKGQFSTSRFGENTIIFGLNPPVEVRRKRISERLNNRLNGGMIEEVEELLKRLSPDQLIYYGLEYKLITQYLIGELDFATMKTRLETEIHRFAKRQMTFFRKMEKDGLTIHWIDNDMPEDAKATYISNKFLEFKSAKSKSITH